MEWFNADSQWRDERRWRLLPTILQYPVRPPEAVASLFDRPAGLLRRWDQLGARRRVVGLAAADAHARMGLGGKTDPYDELVYVKLPSYEAIFRAFSLRVELRRALLRRSRARCRRRDRAQSGPAASTPRSTASPARASLAFSAESGGDVARQGGALAIGRAGAAARRHERPAADARCVLLRDGEVVGRSRRPGARVDGRPARRLPGRGARAGRARRCRRCPGCVSNPIYVGRREPARPTRCRAAGGSPPRVAGGHLAHREGRALDRDGPRRRPAGGLIRHTLRYQLGRGGISPFVALVTDEVGAMHDATRLAFRAAADRPMRLSVQVRLVDGAVERRWQRSVYLSPDAARRHRLLRRHARRGHRANAHAFAPARIHSLAVRGRHGQREARRQGSACGSSASARSADGPCGAVRSGR